MSDDSLENPSNKIFMNISQLNEFCLTPLKSTENLLSPFSVKKQFNNLDGRMSVDVTDGPLDSSLSNPSILKPQNELTSALTYTPENQKPTKMCLNLWNKFLKSPKNELTNGCISDRLPTITSQPFVSSSEVESIDLEQKCKWSPTHPIHQRTSKVTNYHKICLLIIVIFKFINVSFISFFYITVITWSGTKPKRPSFSIKYSPYYKCSPKTSMTSKNKVKQCSK